MNPKVKQVVASSLKCLLLAGAVVVSPVGHAVDTDIFAATSTAEAANVLIVIDNTSNWSKNSQQFPGMIQGQAEVLAIQNVINSLPGFINVGMMEFVTGGNANDNGGYIRQAIVPMGSGQSTGAVNKLAFSNTLSYIYNNINSPTEKFNSNTAYGNLFFDAYNYFAGNTPFATSGDVVSSLADSNGYTTNYTKFKSPLSDNALCGNNYIIFIGNPNQSGPASDTAANLAALAAAGGSTSQLPLQAFTQTNVNVPTNVGYSAACYASAPSSVVDYTSQCPPGNTYASCAYSSTDSTTSLQSCSSGSRYNVVATVPSSTTSSTTVTTTTNTGPSSCYASSSAWTTSDHGGLTCPSNTSSTSGNVTTATNYSCSYSVNSTAVSPNTCPTTNAGPTAQSPTSTSATANSCYSSVSGWGNSTDYGGLSCPSTTTSTSGATTTTTTYACAYSGATAGTSGCSQNGTKHITVTQIATPSVSTATHNTSQYPVTQTVTKTVTTTTTASTQTTLGNTFACYTTAPTGTPTDFTCPSGATCSYGSATGASSTTDVCPSGQRYQTVGYNLVSTEAPTIPAVYSTDTATYNADEWARFLYQTGVPVTGSTVKGKITTYTIDVYNKQPNAVESSLYSSIAKAGGGRYFTATTQSAIQTALSTIFGEIQAANSAFASVGLPLSAAQRTQNDNQVYIGMFRPDQQSLPRWFGNLKRYQLGAVNGGIDLVDVNNVQAISTLSGFFTPCAQSWWTSDSGNYWASVSGSTVTPRIFYTTASTAGLAWTSQGDDTSLAAGGCTTGLGATYSDLPDGPNVEKGGVAEILRNASSRNMLTLSGSTLQNFNSANVTSLSGNSTVNANIVNFTLGQDVTGEINSIASTANRPSIHGAVVHSRPLAVDYGGTVGVKVFYGGNDGAYRAIDAATGTENWSFVAPESYSYLQRLLDNTPPVQSPTPTPPGQTAAPGTPKDFFFDGSTGIYQNADNSNVWIYPTMRRGGRMIYSFDVSKPSTASAFPTYKWKIGCPNLANDTGCVTTDGSDITGIGQTWSTPNLVFLNGYSTTKPVFVVGGGYDSCEDADSLPSASGFCANPKGAKIYVVDAATGAIVKTFATDRSVAGDVSLIDINQDGVVDAAYAADTGGSIYRINFSNMNSFASLAPANWTITKVASTSGANRKFLFAPALLPYKNQVYVAIGSGDREHPTILSYPYTTPVVNRAYVYLDDPTQSPTTPNNLDAMLNQTADNTCGAPSVLPGGSSKGWFLDLTANGVGEQTVTSAVIATGKVAFSTNRPVSSPNSCSASLGEARGYFLNLLNGSGVIGAAPNQCGESRSSVFVGGGLPPSPVIGVVTIGGVPQSVVIGAAKLDGSVSTPIGGQQLNPNIVPKRSRVYWRTTPDTH